MHVGNLPSAFKEEALTVWGAHPSHDGQLYPVYPFYVSNIGNIPEEGWTKILESKALTWVVIPWETSHGAKRD